jgi:hypothetical protein
MSHDRPSRLRTIWLRAWPGWLFLGAVVFTRFISAMGAALSLQQYHVSDIAEFGGNACLIVFGLPLLAAWGLWSALSVRHGAARLGVYMALLLAVLGVIAWFPLTGKPPQM